MNKSACCGEEITEEPNVLPEGDHMVRVGTLSVCSKCNTVVGLAGLRRQPPASKGEGWLTSFREQFTMKNNFGECKMVRFMVDDYTLDDPIVGRDDVVVRKLESFIQTTIDEAVEKERERYEKELEDYNPYDRLRP